jgi:transcriptional regulator with XRE-family HTH domain
LQYAEQRIIIDSEMTFGTLVAQTRKSMGLSQKQLASKIKKENGEPISPQYLNDIERDRRNPPSPVLIQKFARELHIPEDRLCAIAGTMPLDLKQEVAEARPEDVEAAFKAFRRTLQGT